MFPGPDVRASEVPSKGNVVKGYPRFVISLLSLTERVPVLPTLALLALTGSYAAWVLRDNSVWPWDQAWYGQVTLDLDHMRLSGLAAWIEAMLRAIGDKPPLLSWLAQMFVPASGLFGSMEAALLMLNVVIEFALLALIYSVSRRLGANSVASLAAMFLCGGASLHIGLATQFLTEPLQTLCATALISTAWGSERLPLFALSSRVLICVAAAFLAKSSSFVFVIPLLTYIVVARIIVRGGPKENTALFDYFAAALALIFVVMAIGWYMINWKSMTRHFVESTTTNDLSLLYGTIGSFAEKLFFWIGAFGESLSPSPWLLVSILLPSAFALYFCSLKVWRYPIRVWPSEALRTGLLFAAALLGIVVLIVVGLAMQVVEDKRYLAPIIPELALLFGWSLAVLRIKILNWLLTAAVICNAAVGSAHAHRLELSNLSFIVWLKQFEPDRHDKERLREAVDLTCKTNHQRYIFIGVEYSRFNANSAAFYSAQGFRSKGFRCQYTSLGLAEKDPQVSIKRLRAAQPEYFVTIVPELQVKPADYLNQVNLLVLDMITADPHFRKVPVQSPELLIFQRLN